MGAGAGGGEVEFYGMDGDGGRDEKKKEEEEEGGEEGGWSGHGGAEESVGGPQRGATQALTYRSMAALSFKPDRVHPADNHVFFE